MTTSCEYGRCVSGLVLGAVLVGCSPGATADPGGELRSRSLDLAPSVGTFAGGVYWPIDDEVVLLPEGQKLVLNGNAAISFLGAGFAGTLDDEGSLQDLESFVPVRGAFTLEASVQEGSEFSQPIPLPGLPLALPAISAAGGNFSVVPTLFGELVLSGSARTTARASLVLPFELAVRFPGLSSPEASEEAPLQVRPAVGLPDATELAELELDATLRLGVWFEIVVNGAPVGGPVVDSTLALGVGLTAFTSPAVRGSLGVNSNWCFAPGSACLAEGSGLALASADLVGMTEVSPALPTVRWSRALDVGSDSMGAAVPSASGLAFAGNASLSGAFLAEVDRSGVPLWQAQREVQVGTGFAPTTMATAANGDLLLAGTSGPGSGLRVERVTATGQSSWARTLAQRDTPLASWQALLPGKADGLLLGGQLTGTDFRRRLLFAQLSQAGELEWATQIDTGGATTSAALAELVRTPSGLLAVGTVSNTGIGNQDILIVRLAEQDGTVLSARAIGGRGTESATSAVVFTDGSYAVAGAVPTLGLDSEVYPCWVAMFSAQDEPLWSATYLGELASIVSSSVTALSVTRQGALLAAGRRGIGTGQDAWWMQLDAVSGMPQWHKRIVGPNMDTFTAVHAVDGGLLAAGSTRLAGASQSDFWLNSASFDGMLHFTQESGFVASNPDVGWAPVQAQRTVVLAPFNVPVSLTSTERPAPALVVSSPGQLLTE